MVMPLLLRSSKKRGAYLSSTFSSLGSMRVAFSMFVSLSSLAFALISAGSPMSITSAMPSAMMRAAAVSVRGSVPSGSTMRWREDLAFAVSFSKSPILIWRYYNLVVVCCVDRLESITGQSYKSFPPMTKKLLPSGDFYLFLNTISEPYVNIKIATHVDVKAQGVCGRVISPSFDVFAAGCH